MKEVTLTGRYTEGLKRGRYFMSIKEYKMQFIARLGINPYHGTFNVTLSGINIAKFDRIKRSRGIAINGFRKSGRTFGDVVGYRAEISGIKCALIIPRKTAHRDVAEIISEKILRRALKTRPGDRVRISVFA